MNAEIVKPTVNVWDMPVPEGYIRNAKGDLVHVSNVSEADRMRTDLVEKTVEQAFQRAHDAQHWQDCALADIWTFCELSAERFGTTFGQGESVTLQSICGRFKILVDRDDTITLNESIAIAKQLLDECIADWTEGGKPQAVALVKDTFRPGRNGNISIARLMVLLSHRNAPEFKDDEKYQRVCSAIEQSIQTTGKRLHMRFYMRKTPQEKWTMAEWR